MAETVWLNDGSMEVVFGDKQTFLERLINQRLGRDAERFFTEFLKEKEEEIQANARCTREAEMTADSYGAMCHDAMECLKQIVIMCDAPRVDKAKLQAVARQGYEDLYENL